MHGNDGTFVGNAGYQGGTNIPPAPGNVDALELDGFGDYLTVADSPTLDIPGSMTVSAWVSLDTNKVEHNIVSKDTPANPTNYNVNIYNNRVFFSVNGTLTIPAGSTLGIISVPVIGDSLYEIDEDLVVQLSNPVSVTILDGQGTGVIANDDTAPSVLINNLTVTEENNGTIPMNFTVTLSKISGAATSVNFITVDDTATAGTDYNGESGTVTIPAGQTTTTISIAAFGDDLFETNETFFINLSLSGNGSIADAQGKAVIENDDVPPSLTVDDVSVWEGNSGSANSVFRILLSAPSGLETTVRVQTANDTANFKKEDYVRTVETITIPPGQISAEVFVPIIGDIAAEPNETFFVNLAASKNAFISDNEGICTIRNDD